MTEAQVAFLIWIIMGIIFMGYGVYAMKSKREVPFGFWANAEMFPVNDVKAYNRAVGKLFFGFGIAFSVLGMPLLKGDESGLMIISMIGAMFAAIVTMGIYIIVIENKYRKK